MTLPFERTSAVIDTGRFLLNLTDPKVTPGVPKILRHQAKSLLRHYPNKADLSMVSMGWGNSLVGFVGECPFSDPAKKGF